MMLSWGKACSTVPSGPLPPPPPPYLSTGADTGGVGATGWSPTPPPYPTSSTNCKKSIWNHHFMTYVFKNKYFTNIFVKGMWFHIFGTWKVKSNTYTIDLNLKFTCLTTNPPPPLSINGLAQGQWGGGWLAPPPPESCIRPCLSKLQLDGFSCLGARNSSTWRVWALYRPTEKACPRTSLLSTTGLSATTRSCTTRRATCPSTARSSKTSLVRGFRLFFEYLKSPSAPVMMVILVLKSKGCHFEYCK